jgi:hypothetical protein
MVVGTLTEVVKEDESKVAAVWYGLDGVGGLGGLCREELVGRDIFTSVRGHFVYFGE